MDRWVFFVLFCFCLDLNRYINFPFNDYWFLDAGDAFCKAAEIQLKQNSKHEAATMYIEAANSYKKSDAQRATAYLLKASDIYIDMVNGVHLIQCDQTSNIKDKDYIYKCRNY